MRTILALSVLTLLTLLSSCEGELEGTGEVMGLRPVYATAQEMEIAVQSPREICKPGKIYTYGHYLLINEQYKGIHIINNTDPSSPQALGFLKIAGNVDMAVRNGHLYADQLSDLLVFNLTNPAAPRLVTKLPNSFNEEQIAYPAQTNVKFECADSKKGAVIGWEEAVLKNPKCYR